MLKKIGKKVNKAFRPIRREVSVLIELLIKNNVTCMSTG